MGVKDQGLQEYLKDNERFADFVNGTLFAGKQIVDPCYLKEVQRKKRVCAPCVAFYTWRK